MSITDGLELVSSHAYASKGVPHSLWTRMRAESPVHWCSPKGFAPFWAITKHADICEISKQPEIFSSAEGIAMIPEAQEEIVRQQDLGGSMRVIIEMDPPEHRSFRKRREPGLHAARGQGHGRRDPTERARARRPARRA